LDEKFSAENLKLVPETFNRDFQNFKIDKKKLEKKIGKKIGKFFLEKIKHLNMGRAFIIMLAGRYISKQLAKAQRESGAYWNT
jgi:hypothetical protein